MIEKETIYSCIGQKSFNNYLCLEIWRYMRKQAIGFDVYDIDQVEVVSLPSQRLHIIPMPFRSLIPSIPSLNDEPS